MRVSPLPVTPEAAGLVEQARERWQHSPSASSFELYRQACRLAGVLAPKDPRPPRSEQPNNKKG